MSESTQEQKDSMWLEMDKHLAYLEGTSESGTSYTDSLYYLTEMLNGWNYIGERDVTKYQDVLTNTTRMDLEAQSLINDTSKASLSATDWYITRESETGVAVPSDISTKRAKARDDVIS